MNRMQKIGAAIAAVAGLGLLPQAHAQTVFIGTGSSALWQTVGIAGWELSGKAHHYTFKLTGTAGVTDTRANGSNAIGIQQGSFWVVWDNSTAPTKVYAGVSLDSTVGDRLFLGTNSAGAPAGKLVLPSTIPAAANLIKVTWGSDDASLPAAVVNALKAKPGVTAAFTDIRPEDAAFATARAKAAHGVSVGDGAHNYYGLGYDGALTSTPSTLNWVESSYSSSAFQVVPFNAFGTDPISGAKIPAFTTNRVGFSPIVLLVNRGNASGLGAKNSGGNFYFTNLSQAELSNLWSAGTTKACNTSVFAVSGAPDVALTVNRREPLSGTYNTFEYQGVNVPYTATLANQPSQENSVIPVSSASSANPLDLNCAGSPDGVEKRAIGTGEMVSEIAAVNDSIGYAFFSFGNVSSIAGNPKYGYLTVNGVDPLKATYGTGGTAGELPSSGTLSSLFSNVKNGKYPIWSDLRIVTNATFQSLAASLTTQIINDINSGTQLPDFLPYSASLVLYRSHYANPYTSGAPSNGLSGAAENGGDVNGCVETTGNTLSCRL